jgi:hypothetical protein
MKIPTADSSISLTPELMALSFICDGLATVTRDKDNNFMQLQLTDKGKKFIEKNKTVHSGKVNGKDIYYNVNYYFYHPLSNFYLTFSIRDGDLEFLSTTGPYK